MGSMIGKLFLLCFCWGLVIVVAISLCESNAPQTTIAKKQQERQVKEEKEYEVSLIRNDSTVQLPLEQYLMGVVASEMPYTFEGEALKAQAVAARTFVMQRNLCVDGTTASQVYHSDEELIEIYQDCYQEMKQKIEDAVNATKGEVLTYDGEYITALFCSSNNGKSNDASWYYQNEIPYLKSVDSHWDENFPQTISDVEIAKTQIQSALNITNFCIGAIDYYENGYVKSIVWGGKVFSGREIREALQLRSSCFSIREQADCFQFHVQGYGHGVGMSQYGAQGMALEGKGYQEILQHYYQGVEITTLP